MSHFASKRGGEGRHVAKDLNHEFKFMAPHVFPTLYQEKMIAFSLFFRPAAALQFHLTRTGRKIFLRGGLDNKQFRRKKRRGKKFFFKD